MHSLLTWGYDLLGCICAKIRAFFCIYTPTNRQYFLPSSPEDSEKWMNVYKKDLRSIDEIHVRLKKESQGYLCVSWKYFFKRHE